MVSNFWNSTSKLCLIGGFHLVWEDGGGLVDGGGVLLTGDVTGDPDLLGVVHAHSRGLGEDDCGEGHGGGVLLTCEDVAWAPIEEYLRNIKI